MQTRILQGPGGLRVELDRSQVFPDDPGNGTPAMCYLGRDSATYWCARDVGEIDYQQLTDAQCKWLHDIDDEINEFLFPEAL